MQSAITEPQVATYQQLRRGKRGENPSFHCFSSVLLLFRFILLFFLCSHILNFYPQDNYFFFFTHKSNTEMFIPHSLTRTIKMIHFLHLCGFYFLTFIWLFVIRLQPVFGRFDNRTVNLSHGAQQSKKTILCLNACLCVPAPYHALTNTQWGSREVWNQFQYPSSNGESIRDRQ